MKPSSILATVLLLALAVLPLSGQALDLTTCTDPAGKSIEGLADASLPILVQAGRQEGRRVLRYNPDLLPQLAPAAKAFFYAQACARLLAGNRPDVVRRADCAALQMLREAGILGQDEPALARLQAELSLPEETWEQLPGPRRRFDFAACSRSGSLLLPEAGPATPRQRDWDACVRQCGDSLYRCPGKGSGAGCQEAYDRCHGACGT